MNDATSDPRQPRTDETDSTQTGSAIAHPAWCTFHFTETGSPDRCFGDEVKMNPAGMPTDEWGNPSVRLYAQHDPSRSTPAEIHLCKEDFAGIVLAPGEAIRLSLELAKLATTVDPGLVPEQPETDSQRPLPAPERPTGCPVWCNRKHTPGGNPRRQRHGRSWRPSGSGSSQNVRAAMYAFGAAGLDGPGIFFDVDGNRGLASLPDGRGGVLAVDDVRSLALDLLYMADCAERETRR